MSKSKPKRSRVERGIYTRTTADGRQVFEVVYRDSDGRQRWERIDGGVRVARARRDDVAGRKARGEKVRPRPNLRFNQAADAWWTDKAMKLRPNTQSAYAASLDQIPDGRAKHQGIAFGEGAADHIIALRADDGRFAPVTFDMTPGPGVWRPTPPAMRRRSPT